MNTTHPSEKDIQQYAIEKSECYPELIEHIETCPECKAEVIGYQLLFSEIKQQPGPEFEFDLSDLVLPLLPKSRPRLSADEFVAGFLIFFICCFICIPAIIFRKYILNMFSDVSPFFVYAIIGSAVVILVYKTLGIYKKYQKQLQFLNFN